MSTDPTLLDDLEWRGLIAHSTDREALRQALVEGSVRFYVGFDPTAPSLHMGNLVQILTARRLQQAGHTPYALVGGATGMIGDPRESGERTLNDLDTVKDWVEKVHGADRAVPGLRGRQRRHDGQQLRLDREPVDHRLPARRRQALPGQPDARRATWCAARLEAGISYTEFSYVLLQSMDFLNLYRDHGVRLQFGGSDQWGNLTGGVELIRRSVGRAGARVRDAAGDRADGTQVRQDRGRGPLARPRDDVAVRLPPVLAQRRGREGRGAAAHLHLPHPRGDRGPRRADRREAVPAGRRRRRWPTRSPPWCTAQQETEHAKDAAAALFGGGDLRGLRERDPPGRAARGRRDHGVPRGTGIVDLLVESGLVKSKGEARRTIAEGGAYLNNERVTDADLVPGDERPAGRRLAGAAPRQEEPGRRGAGLSLAR